MTITEVIPIVDALSHSDKFKLMQFILEQIAKGEGIALDDKVSNEKDSLWDIVGMAEGEDEAVAKHHDKYLYGVK